MPSILLLPADLLDLLLPTAPLDNQEQWDDIITDDFLCLTALELLLQEQQDSMRFHSLNTRQVYVVCMQASWVVVEP